MQYLLLIYGPEPDETTPPEVLAAMLTDYSAFTQEVRDRGAFIAAEALQPVATATTVRVRDGQTVTTDGPFAETKELLGGFYLIDVRDLDEAIELAAKIPGARAGSIEVRPIWDTNSGSASQPETAGATA
jgi:hypothetical protein